MLALDHIAFQQVVRKQSAIQGAFQHPRHGVAGDVEATRLELLANLFGRQGGILILPSECLLDERSLGRVEVQYLVHPLVAYRRIAAPMALPEPCLGAVHASFPADVILLLGPYQLLVFHAGAIDLLVVDRHGRRLDGDAVLRFQFLLDHDGGAALARETRIVIEDDVADLVHLFPRKGQHFLEILADAARLGAFAPVAELGHDLVAVALGELPTRPCLNFEAHAVLLGLAGNTGVEDAPLVSRIHLFCLSDCERLEQIEVIHAHASFG